MDSIVPPQSSYQPQPLPPYQSEPIEEFEEITPEVVDDFVVPETVNSPEPQYQSLTQSVDFSSEEKKSAPTPEPLEVLPEETTEEPIMEVAIEPAVELASEVEQPTEKVSYADSTIQELEVSKIVANPYQPRTQFKPEALQELADSIREHGVIQPIVVTETSNGYEIVVGERRFRASQLAGLTKVPAIVKKTLHDQTKLEVALIENIQRQELNAIEEARGYDRLIKSFNLTQDQVAKKVGKSRSAVANTLRLLNLPAEIQRGVIEGKVTEGHARAILGLGDIEKMILMYQTIQDQGWNVRQVEAKVREITVKRRMDAAAPDPKLMAIETELRGKLGAQVKIQRQGRGGKITIDFFSDDDLDEIIHRIAEQKAGGDDNYLVV
jgi:ParB family transcriptional regulator, chromosome partitioning protein